MEPACTGSAAPSTESWRTRSSRIRTAPVPHANHERVLRACEAAVERLATDRHYFARPARTLFRDIRAYFPMSVPAARAPRDRALPVLRRRVPARQPQNGFDVYGNPLQCRASTRKGTPCQRMPLPHNGYCPSHQHLAETEEVTARSLPDAQVRWFSGAPHARGPVVVAGASVCRARSRRLAQRFLYRRAHAARRRRRRDLHRRRARLRRPRDHGQGADHARRPVRGRDGGGPGGARAGRDARPREITQLLPRHDGRDERAAGGPRRAHGADRHRGLHRRRRARAPEPGRALPAVRRAGRRRSSPDELRFGAPSG